MIRSVRSWVYIPPDVNTLTQEVTCMPVFISIIYISYDTEATYVFTNG